MGETEGDGRGKARLLAYHHLSWAVSRQKSPGEEWEDCGQEIVQPYTRRLSVILPRPYALTEEIRTSRK